MSGQATPIGPSNPSASRSRDAGLTTPSTEAPRSLRVRVFSPIGFVGGLFGGQLGVGGGSAIAPLLLLFGSMRPARVSGTTLATVLVISGVGSVTYASLGHIDLELAWPIAIGSIVGVVLGAITARGLS
ncbi:MAG: sulfite exporter TauE/SafE family protein, partial [Euryarchaeota archaeon]|nr:sulfite exporter TauE/SafE family protein [Euryarchaeota archaeon]